MNGQGTTTKPKLLLITTDFNQILALSEFLGYDYEVLTAGNGEEGVNLLAQYKHRIDVLITDLKTLKTTGLDVLNKAKQQYAALQLIVIKHVGAPALSDDLTGRTVITYIAEPFEYDQLRTIIQQALTRKTQPGSDAGQTLELADLVQLYCLSAAKVALTVVRETAQGKEQGNIYCENGKVTNAVCGKQRGKAAFATIMRWEAARYITRYGVVAKQKDVNLPWETLLREALRQQAEPAAEEMPPLQPEETPLPQPEPPPVEPAPEEPSAAPPTMTFAPHEIEAIQHALEELHLESAEDLDNAVVTDAQGVLVGEVASEQAQTKSALIGELTTKVFQFSVRSGQELDLGVMDEVMIFSESGLLLVYPVAETRGVLGVATVKDNQGMTRWNCREAVEKMMQPR